MKQLKFLSILLMIVFFAGAANGKEKKPWNDIAELSLVDTGGNSDVKSTFLNNTLKYTHSESILSSWKLSILSSETDGKKTAEKYSTSYRVDFKITGKIYSIGDLLWLKDQFAGIEQRYRYSVGLGYKILGGPKHKLSTEAGLNYTAEEYLNNTGDDYMGGRLFVSYAYNFTEKNFFSQWIEYLPDFDDSENYIVNAETSLVAALNSALSMKTSYLIAHDAEPVPGNKKTDTKLAVTLVINF